MLILVSSSHDLTGIRKCWLCKTTLDEIFWMEGAKRTIEDQISDATFVMIRFFILFFFFFSKVQYVQGGSRGHFRETKFIRSHVRCT